MVEVKYLKARGWHEFRTMTRAHTEHIFCIRGKNTKNCIKEYKREMEKQDYPVEDFVFIQVKGFGNETI